MRVRLAKLLSMRFAAEAVTVLILALLVLGVGYYVSPEPALLQTVSDKPKFGTAMRTTANTLEGTADSNRPWWRITGPST